MIPLDLILGPLSLMTTYALYRNHPTSWALKAFGSFVAIGMNIQYHCWGMLPFAVLTAILSTRAALQQRKVSCGYFNATNPS